jgi:hypothetical protein
MGIFNSLTQLSGGDYSSAMNPTGSGVFTPSNPGQLDTVRTVPVVPNTRSFTPPEAARLQALAEQRAVIAQASQEAYKALESIEESDRKVHEANRNYRGIVAKEELNKKKADSKYLTTLNNLREGYGAAAAALLESRKKSELRLEAIEARTRQILKGY